MIPITVDVEFEIILRSAVSPNYIILQPFPVRPLTGRRLDQDSTESGGQEEKSADHDTGEGSVALGTGDRRGAVIVLIIVAAATAAVIAVAVAIAIILIVIIIIIIALLAGPRNDSRIGALERLRVAGSRGAGVAAVAAEDVLVLGALVEQAVGQVLGALLEGEAVEAAVVVVADDVGALAALLHAVDVVIRVGHRAGNVADGRVVEVGGAGGARRRGRHGGGGGRHVDYRLWLVCIKESCFDVGVNERLDVEEKRVSRTEDVAMRRWE